MKDMIAALAALASSSSSDEDKAAALEKLTAYFNSQLDEEEAQPSEAASEVAEGDEEKPKAESASEVGDADSAGPSKEMASALAQIAALKARMAKMEKASAVGSAPRAAHRPAIPRVEPPPQKDQVVSMIEAAERNTLRNLSK